MAPPMAQKTAQPELFHGKDLEVHCEDWTKGPKTEEEDLGLLFD